MSDDTNDKDRNEAKAEQVKDKVTDKPVEGKVDPDPKRGERGDLDSDDTSGELATPGQQSTVTVGEVRKGLFGVRGTGDTSGYGGLTRRVEWPGESHRPYGEGDLAWFDDVVDRLVELRPELGEPVVVVHRGELTLHIPREQLSPVAKLLRDDPQLRFEFCSGVSGVHYPSDTGRELHAVIHLVSMTHNRRIRVEVACPDSDPHIPSIVPTYPAADWHERETWDMFGIVFDGHPGLTRILMPDDWPGHPQRKDYPLGGVDVEYKGATIPPPDQRRSYN